VSTRKPIVRSWCWQTARCFRNRGAFTVQRVF